MPIRVGPAGPLLESQDGIQRRLIRKRCTGCGGVGEHPDPIPLGHGHLPPGQPGCQILQAVGTGVHADPVQVRVPVERLADIAPVAQQPGAHRERITVTNQQGHDPARSHDLRDSVQ